MIDPKRIGRRIAEERKLGHGLSQEKMVNQMRDKLGVSWNQPDLSNLERGGTAVYDLQKLDLLATFFDIPLQSLLFGEGMESRMECYYGSRMTIRAVSPEEKSNPVHAKKLEALAGGKIAPTTIFRYVCGRYRIYIHDEVHSIHSMGDGPDVFEGCRQFDLPKLRVYVFFEDGVVGTLWAAVPTIFMLMCMKTLGGLQRMIPMDVIDVTDPARRLNPWMPMLQFARSVEERNDAERRFMDRVSELRPINANPVFLIESAYVRESCRRKGILRLMLDVLEARFGRHLMWLNMEPTDGEELDSPYFNYPEYTRADVGQFSINAAIAEKLGFTVDSDIWRRYLKSDGGDGREETVEVRKCAFRMPDYVKEVVGRDGTLVEQGREAQRDFYDFRDSFKRFHDMINGRDDEASDVGQVKQSDIADTTMVMRHGACIMEFIVPIGGGRKRIVAGIRPKHGDTWFAVADRSFVRNGLDIDTIERHASPSGTRQHVYRKYFEMAAGVLLYAPEMLSAEKKAEWDKL